MKRIHKSGKTIVHVTHNQIECFSLGNKIAVMNSGEIVQTSKPKELFVTPGNKFVARFLGYENIFDAKLVEKQGSVSLVNVNGVKLKVSEVIDTPECTVAIRPEDVNLSSSPKRNGATNVLEGTVIEFVDQGPTVSVIVDIGLSFSVNMTKRVFVDRNLELDQKVWLSFKSESLKVIN
ncbi:MAG: TOBE domain-containing protein [Candidatus Bathyarchaeota archaeon]|nr:TOBE domain-containing protein [Candidatus Bathyarchaeum sp.]